MADYDRTNTGALFKNDRKESERHPDYTGSINVGGTDYWLSAWLKTDRNGKRFMSLSVKPKDEVRHHEDRKSPGAAVSNGYQRASNSATRDSMNAQRPAAHPAGAMADMDDDIPFVCLGAGRAWAVI